LTILAGNVATPEMVQELLISGAADIVKIGIGPGSVCATRTTTGVGYPQLSAIIECADAAHGLRGHVCADGGCRVPGDVVKAFAAGADFVMLGGMLAGHDECDGTWIEQDGQRVAMPFYGMASRTAMERYAGGIKDYRACEGKEVAVAYRGPVKDTLREILGGIRSACAYVGAGQLKELCKCTTFVLCRRTHNRVFDA
jgi:GMP reductase